MTEERAIPSAPGYYATEAGDIVSRVRKTPRTLRAHFSRYAMVHPQVDKVASYRSVHNLVAEAFHGPCPDGLQVAHLDGNPRNNRPENLRYVTPKENARHRTLHGTSAAGERHGMAKLSADDVLRLRQMFASGVKRTDIAKEFGVTERTVYSVGSVQTWGCVA